ncbi:MAG TPA: LysR substrate-binding domain-containing protein [Steroidobacteraceae bacterium]|jgi:LysR family glycine cleavage system transcriptional activator|nr:LysR substrate-binding domain-containing protein [Steroidobacteraceae bacterium]
MAAAYDRLPLGALRVFEAVATHLNFSAAAEALNVTPAAVSQQIKSLEGYIQVPLFRRNGRGVQLTEEGVQLLPSVRSGLDQLQSAVNSIKQHGRSGPLQITLLSSFLQIWLMPRIRSFRRKHPEIELRFHTSSELVDFSRTAVHVGIRFGRGSYPNLHSEKLLDDWVVPVGTPPLIKQYGMIERGMDLSRYPLLEGDEPSWSLWRRAGEEIAWRSRPPAIDDTVGLLVAAEEGLGFALARWTMVTRALSKGTLKLASREALPYGSAYYFVCPRNYLTLPKVARFREWLFAAARDFPAPSPR